MHSIQLRNNYRVANDSLTQRASATESARTRAQQLLQRASTITVSTNSKLKQLQDMADTYQINEKELNSLKTRVGELDHEMTRYVDRIQERSDFYRQCTS